MLRYYMCLAACDCRLLPSYGKSQWHPLHSQPASREGTHCTSEMMSQGLAVIPAAKMIAFKTQRASSLCEAKNHSSLENQQPEA